MSLYHETCEEFTKLTYSKAPAPGGGSVASLVASLGAALGGMVGNLTTGKKKYAQYEEDIQRLLQQTEELRARFLRIMDDDVNNFLPLSKAYGMPTTTDEEKAAKAAELEKCLKAAAGAPLELISACAESVPLFEELQVKGSKLALSDVGCGIALIKAASDCAWLNALININMIKDEAYVNEIKDKYIPMVADTAKKCDAIYAAVAAAL